MSLNGFMDFFQKGKVSKEKRRTRFQEANKQTKNQLFNYFFLQTFRPKKRFVQGTIRYSLHKQAQASLQSGINLRQVVELPPGENMNDWLAVHVVDFFNRINLIYGTVSEYCNETTCSTMSGGPRYEYLWADGDTFKKPTQLPAPKYIELLMDWTESQINNEALFPVSTDVPFPKTFSSLCRKILTRLFRVFVHVYIHHFDRIVSIGAVSFFFFFKLIFLKIFNLIYRRLT